MSGTILENLSTKKLSILVGILLVLQVVCFLIGGLIGEMIKHEMRKQFFELMKIFQHQFQQVFRQF